MTDPKPGTIFLTKIDGFVGKLVWLLQALNGDTSKWTHAGVVLDDGTVFEAQPGGSQIRPLYTDREVLYIDVVADHSGTGKHALGVEHLRAKVVAEAREHEGIGYGWSTYLYLAAYRLAEYGLHLPFLVNLLKWRVSNSRRLICSQAVDHVMKRAGVELFDDGRLPYDVSPGDIARIANGGNSWISKP